MTYLELLFRRPDDGLIYPDQARQLVALACDGIDIDPGIFARDASGKTLNGFYGQHTGVDGQPGISIPPRIVFDGGRGFIRLYGLGKAGAALLQAQAPKLFAALYAHGFRSFDAKEGAMGIAWKDSGALPFYAIRTLVVAKKPAQCQRYIKAPLEGDVAEQVKASILRGLAGVAQMLDEELMACGKSPMHLGAMPDTVEVLEGEPCPVSINSGITAAGYKNLLLHFPCKFSGPWVTGMLRSRGYGLMRAINPNRRA